MEMLAPKWVSIFVFLMPHFYVAKLRFTWVYIILLISALNIGYGYSLELLMMGIC